MGRALYSKAKASNRKLAFLAGWKKTKTGRVFGEVTDFREEGRCLHELSGIILLVLCELLADCATFEEIYDYACDTELVLRRVLALPAGIPSSYTLRRVFCDCTRAVYVVGY